MKVRLFLILFMVSSIGYSQGVIKYRMHNSDVTTNIFAKPVLWIKTPASDNTLLVYDDKRRKINIYSDKPSDLSITKFVEVQDIKKESGLQMFDITAIDQDNVEVMITLFVKKHPDGTKKTSMLIMYSYATYRFELIPD